MRFCSGCGASVRLAIPTGDNRERHICDACGAVHYQNPRVVTGCVVGHGDKVLLCRRAIEPRKGYWTLPAGFLEMGETAAAGAARETYEEACAEVRVHALYTVFNLPYISQIYMFHRAELMTPNFAPGPESLAVELFSESDIPWRDLAFVAVAQTLRFYFDDRAGGHFPMRVTDILQPTLRR